jgi:uncharacterized membrane protein
MGALLLKFWPHALGVVLLGLLSLQTARVGWLKDELAATSQSLKTARGDFATCDTERSQGRALISALRAAHDQCMEVIKVGTKLNEVSVEALNAAVIEIDRRANAAARDREIIFRQPGCRELAQMDIAAACPDLAERMRERSKELSRARED